MTERRPEAPTFEESVLENPGAIMDAVDYMESGLEEPVRTQAAERFVDWLNDQWKVVKGLVPREPLPSTPDYSRSTHYNSTTVITDFRIRSHSELGVTVAKELSNGTATMTFKVNESEGSNLEEVRVHEHMVVSGSKHTFRKLVISFPKSENFTTSGEYTEVKSNEFPLRANVPAQQS